MKRILCGMTALIGGLCLFVATTGCSGGPSKQEVLSANDSLTQVALRQQNELSDLMETMSEVTRQLDEINGTIRLNEGELDPTLADRRDDLIKALDDIRRQIADKEKAIAELEKKYASVLSQNKELKKTVERMQKDLARSQETVVRYEQSLAENAETIRSLTGDVSRMADSLRVAQADNADKQQILTAQDEMLNCGYYIVAPKKALKELGLITGTGLFQKPRLDAGNLDAECFTACDIRSLTQIPLGAKKVTVVSPMPEGSYRLDKQDDGTLTLVVTDAAQFWSVTRFLVIML